MRIFLHSIEYAEDNVKFLCEGRHHPVLQCTIFSPEKLVLQARIMCYSCWWKIEENGNIEIRPSYLEYTRGTKPKILKANIQFHPEIPCFRCNQKVPRIAGSDVLKSCNGYSVPLIEDGKLSAIISGMNSQYESVEICEELIPISEIDITNYRDGYILCDTCISEMIERKQLQYRWKL